MVRGDVEEPVGGKSSAKADVEASKSADREAFCAACSEGVKAGDTSDRWSGTKEAVGLVGWDELDEEIGGRFGVDCVY